MQHLWRHPLQHCLAGSIFPSNLTQTPESPTFPVTSSGVRSTSGATQGSMVAAVMPAAAERTMDTCAPHRGCAYVMVPGGFQMQRCRRPSDMGTCMSGLEQSVQSTHKKCPPCAPSGRSPPPLRWGGGRASPAARCCRGQAIGSRLRCIKVVNVTARHGMALQHRQEPFKQGIASGADAGEWRPLA